MRKASMFIALGFLLCVVGVSAADDIEFKGHITDDMCGGKHTMEDVSAKECADKCVKGGAKYALFVPGDDEKMYVVDDQEKAKEFLRHCTDIDGRTLALFVAPAMAAFRRADCDHRPGGVIGPAPARHSYR